MDRRRQQVLLLPHLPRACEVGCTQATVRSCMFVPFFLVFTLRNVTMGKIKFQASFVCTFLIVLPEFVVESMVGVEDCMSHTSASVCVFCFTGVSKCE